MPKRTRTSDPIPQSIEYRQTVQLLDLPLDIRIYLLADLHGTLNKDQLLSRVRKRTPKELYNSIRYRFLESYDNVQRFLQWVSSRILPDVPLCRAMLQFPALYETGQLESILQFDSFLFGPEDPLDHNHLSATLFGCPYRKYLSVKQVRQLWVLLDRPERTRREVVQSAFLVLLAETHVLDLSVRTDGFSRCVYELAIVLRRDFELTGFSDLLHRGHYKALHTWLQTNEPWRDAFLPIVREADLLYLQTWHRVETDIVEMVQTFVSQHRATVHTDDRIVPISDQEGCCICLELFSSKSALQKACGHHFHRACIDQWLSQNETCPLCRAISTVRTPRQKEFVAWLRCDATLLNAQQYNASLYAIQNQLTVVTGAGGTGKTEVASVLGRFVHDQWMMANNYMRGCVFLAPTGKAAETIRARLGSICHVTTIHRWILQESARPQSAKCIPFLFVDECGMVNLWLMWHLLQMARRTGVQRIVFFGDPHQLPPVRNDGTLLDALVCLRAPMVHSLVQNYRSTPGLLAVLDHLRSVATGTDPCVHTESLQTPESLLEIVDDDTALYRTILKHMRPPMDGRPQRDTRILVSRKEPLLEARTGDPQPRARFLAEAYELFNPQSRGLDHIRYRVGDLVMCTKNVSTPRYKDEDGNWSGGEMLVSNGSEGVVQTLDPLSILFGDGLLLTKDSEEEHIQKVFANLSRGLISTVHKFQGSEQDKIIAVFTGTNKDFNTIQLLYTAASRAKQELVIVIMRNTLRQYLVCPSHVSRNAEFNRRLRVALG